MNALKSVCVYCGSRTGVGDQYSHIAERMGRLIADAGLTLVYGAGSIGLMGIVARTVLAQGGQAIGIIPEHLDRVEVSLDGLSELHIVPNMHVRKRMMFDRADAFVALPGGLGTLDELIEVTTWAQLGLHNKPIVVVNQDGYWDALIELVDHVIDHGFAGPESAQLFTVVDDIADVLPTLASLYEPEPVVHADLI